jgi:hypothetical protein
MPGPARQHVAFAEQQTLMQPGRRAVSRVKKQIHFVAIRLLYQPRGCSSNSARRLPERRCAGY